MNHARPVLSLVLPCNECGAEPGARCVRRDGQSTARSHHRRTLIAPCGTYGGYQRHIKAAERPCEECKEANRRYMQARRVARPDERAVDVARLKARREATRRLIERHRVEFDRLMTEVSER